MNKTKKIMMILAASCTLALGAFMTSCETTKAEPNLIGMANPFITSPDLAGAEEVAGFSIKLPSKEVLPEWVVDPIYRASNVNTQLLEIIYPDSDDPLKEVRIRKAISEKEDISGDFNDYEEEEIITFGGKEYKARLNGEKIFLLTWEEGEFKYSVRNSEGANKMDFAKLIAEIR